MHDSSQSLREVFFSLCKIANTPFSLKAWLLYKYNDPGLLELEVKYDSYNTSHTFAVDYQIASFLKKFKGFAFGIDTQNVALSKFASAETTCKYTNERFKFHRRNPIRLKNKREYSIISIAARKISELIGPFSIVDANSRCKWGPGATATLKGRRVRRDLKHCELPMSVTPGALGIFRAHLESDPLWFEALTGFSVGGAYSVLPSCFVVQDWNRVITVPKNAKTDRTIAAEPTANSFLQQGVGRLIRSKLRRVGVDLDDQSRNQRLAGAAHRLGLSTIDLSAASDTVSRELVYELLPLDWAIYLDRLRSPSGVLPDGSKIRYEKWSSMGNAYTFELESLIFWGLTQAVKQYHGSDGPSAIYGDDIICPSECAHTLIEVLAFCGFSTNTEKTFISGNFYESCGKHFFQGFDVTPFYQKETLETYPEQIRFINRIRRWINRLYPVASEESNEYKVWLCAVRVFPYVLRWAIPHESLEDSGVILSSSEWPMSGRIRRYCPNRRAYKCTVLRPVSNRRPGYELSLYSQVLRHDGFVEDPSYGKISPRRSPAFKTRTVWITL